MKPDKELKEIVLTRTKRSSYMKVSNEMLDASNIEIGNDTSDYSLGLKTLLVDMYMMCIEEQKETTVVIDYEMPLDWFQHLKKRIGLSYKKKTMYKEAKVHVNYEAVFPDIPVSDRFKNVVYYSEAH